MRILVDTNILFSAVVFPRSRPAQALLHIADNHEMVLCDRNIMELRDILGRKAPKFLPDVEVLLAGTYTAGHEIAVPERVGEDGLLSCFSDFRYSFNRM